MVVAETMPEVGIEPLARLDKIKRHLLCCAPVYLPAYLEYCEQLRGAELLVVLEDLEGSQNRQTCRRAQVLGWRLVGGVPVHRVALFEVIPTESGSMLAVEGNSTNATASTEAAPAQAEAPIEEEAAAEGEVLQGILGR